MFAWDDGAADIDEGLLVPDVSDTADIPAELPGIHLEDSVNGPEHTNTVVEAPPLPGWAVAEQVLTNANLAQTLQTDEITGVDSPNQPLFTDGSDSVGGDDGDGAFNEDPPDQGPPPLLELDETQTGEEDEASKDLFESEADDDANEEDEANDSEDREDGDLESPMMQRRYPLRHRTKKKQTVIDFDGRKYQTADGVIHINPSIIKDRREAFKKTRVYPTYGIENRPKVTIPTPKGRSDQQRLTWDLRSFGASNLTVDDFDVGEGVVIHVVGVIMAQQYTIRKGLKLFGDGGRQAVTKELTQLHNMATYTPMHKHELTREQRVQALSSLMFLTQKRDGRIKGRACANGSKQREYISKESATSPTVATDSLMITAAIDVIEMRDIVALDIPGAFLHANLDEEVIMVLRGELAELMAKVEPKLYRPYIVTTSRGESILYVKMQKAMYGLLRSALLFYLKLR
jgi:hypothetical protein